MVIYVIISHTLLVDNKSKIKQYCNLNHQRNKIIINIEINKIIIGAAERTYY